MSELDSMTPPEDILGSLFAKGYAGENPDRRARDMARQRLTF